MKEAASCVWCAMTGNSSKDDAQFKHSPTCSAIAGSLSGIGNAVLGSYGIETVMHRLESGSPKVNSTNFTLVGLARATVPGACAFETHHAVASLLLHGKIEDDVNVWIRHSYHFVAGSAGGLSFGLAGFVLDKLKIAPKSLAHHILSHGALFGSYDCYITYRSFPLAFGFR